MLLDRLDYFISAARLGSFTKAAQEWDHWSRSFNALCLSAGQKAFL